MTLLIKREKRKITGAVLVRSLIALVVLVALTAFAPAKTGADTEVGEFCWQLSPFPDTLKLTAVQADSDAESPFWALHGRWRAGGAYEIEVSGHVSNSNAPSGTLAFGLSGSLQQDVFGDNRRGINLGASLNPVSQSGPFAISSPGSTFFTNTGTLNPIPCAATMTPSTGSGTALGL